MKYEDFCKPHGSYAKKWGIIGEDMRACKKAVDEIILSELKRGKKETVSIYGLSATLQDKEDTSDYPFTHINLYWDDEFNDDMIEKMNEALFWSDDDDIDVEDFSLFTNSNVTACHNASIGMREDSTVFKETVDEGIGMIKTMDDEFLDRMPADKFSDWYDYQDRYTILDDHADDFYYHKDKCKNQIKELYNNPLKLIGVFPGLEKIVRDRLKKGYCYYNDEEMPGWLLKKELGYKK